MRRFRFRLQPVLDHRRRLAEVKERELAKVAAELAACESRITALIAERDRQLDEPPDLSNMPALAQRETFLGLLASRIAAEIDRRTAITVRVETARALLVAANQAEKAIQQIHDHAQREHLKVAMRLEQRTLDEFATLRAQRPQEPGRTEP